ncbi:MAG: DUF4040 domain-containing protein [Chlamydiia bacterium]|nr:DUF4040 domain-containing protein [Chlamydiia bacterium]
MEVLLAMAILLLGCPIFFWLERVIPRYLGYSAMAFPMVSTGLLLSMPWEVHVFSVEWIPLFGWNLSLLVDGLSLFFGLLVSLMGVLVALYAQHYMTHRKRHLGRFYTSLIFFMGCMLGTVFANELALLFIFWELTGIASFLLIGFLYQEEEACVGARMALLVTGLTALPLLIGILLTMAMTGQSEWTGLSGEMFTGLWSSLALVCFAIGCFGKSAQLPFHFWLPRAMVAPTPVSAYLHAATMVKLGIYLTARLYPLFVSHPLWFPLMSSVCFTTMVFGAILSFLSHDLKAILAYATISQLGFFIGFYGIGDVAGVQYDFVHILNHALYKGSLFMLVGIIHHATGLRDIRQLGGLIKYLPLTACVFAISTAAMAGIPGTTGFLSKEIVLKQILDISGNTGNFLLFALAFSSIFKMAFSLRLFFHLFVRSFNVKIVHIPNLGIHLSPLILALCSIVLGIWPTGLDNLTETFYLSGLHEDTGDLSLWHGWSIELFLSLFIFASGIALFLFAEWGEWRFEVPRWLRFDHGFEAIDQGIQKGTKVLNQLIYPKHLQQFLLVILLFFICVCGPILYPLLIFPPLLTIDLLRMLVTLFSAVGCLGAILLPTRISQLISLSVVGFLLAFYYILYEAPDLAMTQILVETALLLMLLLLICVIPRAKQIPKTAHSLQITLSLLMGLMMATIAVSFPPIAPESDLGTFYLQNTLNWAKGANAVNAILIDFRGFDTVGEVAVLLIAALGSIGLLMARKRGVVR